MSDTSWWVDEGDSTSHCCWVKSLMNFVKVAWGTTGIQILKYLGTESSPWSGLLGLHLIVTTVARPFSHEVVTVEDLIWNKRKNVQSEICFHYRKSALRCHSGSCSVWILLSQGINLARKQDRMIKKTELLALCIVSNFNGELMISPCLPQNFRIILSWNSRRQRVFKNCTYSSKTNTVSQINNMLKVGSLLWGSVCRIRHWNLNVCLCMKCWYRKWYKQLKTITEANTERQSVQQK